MTAFRTAQWGAVVEGCHQANDILPTTSYIKAMCWQRNFQCAGNPAIRVLNSYALMEGAQYETLHSVATSVPAGQNR
jgi:hypothetical protein